MHHLGIVIRQPFMKLIDEIYGGGKGKIGKRESLLLNTKCLSELAFRFMKVLCSPLVSDVRDEFWKQLEASYPGATEFKLPGLIMTRWQMVQVIMLLSRVFVFFSTNK